MNQWVKPSLSVPQPFTHWQARLNLVLSASARGTVLRHSAHQGPLYVQKPFYPEGRELAHLYLLHPPGGMVSGDDLRISITTEPQAQALITTPGAGRVYRARPDRSLQTQEIRLQVHAHSTLEWLPLETIIYPDACTQLSTRIELAAGASVIAWEVTCFGLRAQAEAFTSGNSTQQIDILCEGRLKLRERLMINPAENDLLASSAGLNGCSVNGLMVAGPFRDEEAIQQLIEQLRACCQRAEALASVTLNGEFLQVRYLGQCSEAARTLFIDCWQHIRPQLIGRADCAPRIWAT